MYVRMSVIVGVLWVLTQVAGCVIVDCQVTMKQNFILTLTGCAKAGMSGTLHRTSISAAYDF